MFVVCTINQRSFPVVPQMFLSFRRRCQEFVTCHMFVPRKNANHMELAIFIPEMNPSIQFTWTEKRRSRTAPSLHRGWRRVPLQSGKAKQWRRSGDMWRLRVGERLVTAVCACRAKASLEMIAGHRFRIDIQHILN